MRKAIGGQGSRNSMELCMLMHSGCPRFHRETGEFFFCLISSIQNKMGKFPLDFFLSDTSLVLFYLQSGGGRE